jgi:hypothetical protein
MSHTQDDQVGGQRPPLGANGRRGGLNGRQASANGRNPGPSRWTGDPRPRRAAHDHSPGICPPVRSNEEGFAQEPHPSQTGSGSK